MSLTSYLSQILNEEIIKCGYVIPGDINKLVTISGRPDLSQFQSNFAMQIAKEYGKNPRNIALDVVESLKENKIFSKISIDGPGFLNINVSDEFLVQFVTKISNLDNFGVSKEDKKKIVLDYGGANVAKPLHVGHLRSAIIGEGLKRLAKLLGDDVIGDVHLGDWGRQMGMVISEIKIMQPDLVYFDPNYNGEYPSVSPVSISDLEVIYPRASSDAKSDENRMEEARIATKILQDESEPCHKGYYELWKKIVEVSVDDLKNIYDRLDVHFDLWNGESDADKYVSSVLKILEDKKLTRISEGALIMDVSEDKDTTEVPPLILKTSAGSIGYHATEIATMYDRMNKYNPDEIWYVVDKRQALHFTQCFRAAYKSSIVPESTKLRYFGFGTMNGKDGKPFKTRDGGVMKLVSLLELVKDYEKNILSKNENMSGEEIENISDIVSQGCIKYADASSNRETDYIFDIEKFTNVNGKTGAYQLYSSVRQNSIINKAKDMGYSIDGDIVNPSSEEERRLLLSISKVNDVLRSAYNNKNLNIIADYLYEINSLFNNFYNSFRILTESDVNKRNSWIKLTSVTKRLNDMLLNILVIKVPEKI